MDRTDTAPSWFGLFSVFAVAAAAAVYAIWFASRAILPSESVSAQTTDSLWSVNFSTTDSDEMYNFDFKDDTVDADAVDWPMRFLFHGNAEIDKVKDALNGCGGNPSITPTTCDNGGPQHARFNDTGSFDWDEDSGIKQPNNCYDPGTQHMRLYANDSGDRNWSAYFGYYVFASVHKDYEGGSGGNCDTYYSAEGEESWWVQRMLDHLPGWAQESNSYYWYNLDNSGHWDLYNGDWHWTQSNAWASYVDVD